jgi:OmpA-OmpF porin, OOP family
MKIQTAMIYILSVITLQGAVTGQESKPYHPGKEINTEARELNPIVSPDGSTLFFSRIGYPGSQFDEEIWSSAMRPDGLWDVAVRLPFQFNRITHNLVASVSPDGNVFMIRGAFENGVYKGKGYSFIYREADGWSLPERLNIRYYTNMDVGVYSSGCLSNDGRILLISFSENFGDDRCDLYFSRLLKDGTWSKPVSLGKGVNSRKSDEISPFLAADGITLYFSSDRSGGQGSHDIWMTRRLDESWTRWSEPVNLGVPVNTPGWDAYYSISAKGDFAFMTTTTETAGQEDIVMIPLRREFQPNPVMLVFGKVMDAVTGKPLKAGIFYEVLPDGTEAGSAISGEMDGQYKIILPFGKKYGFSARLDGYYTVNENIDLTGSSAYGELNRNIRLYPIEVGQTIRLNNIFFDVNQAVLRPESFPELNRVARMLLDNPTMRIAIHGHTDQTGSEQHNLVLSEDRAAAVRDYLVRNGVPPARITSQGFGMSIPVSENETEAGKQLNRRVEFVILEK